MQGAERDVAGAEPGQGSHPDRDQRADPGGEEARDQDQRHPGPSEPRRLDQDHRRDDRGAEQERHRGEGAGAGEHRPTSVARRADRPDMRNAETAAERDQGRLRPDHEAEADRGEGREQHPGRSTGWVGAAFRPSAGMWPPLPGRRAIGERGDHTGEGEHREVPPERGALIEAEILGDVGEHPPLYVEDQLQEAPRRQGGDHPDDGREHEHGHERPAAQRGLGIGGSWRLGHVDLAQLVRPGHASHQGDRQSPATVGK